MKRPNEYEVRWRIRNIPRWRECGPSDAKRAAPDGGYDHETKILYRDWVWESISEVSRHWTQRGQHPVAIMPSIEGSEIPYHAFDKHFYDLHVIDRNPAICATLKKRYPSITTYGVSTAKAHHRMARHRVMLSAAHLDYCSPGGSFLAREVADCAAAGVWKNGAMIVINMLRGREPKKDTEREGRPIPFEDFSCSAYLRLTPKDLWRMWRVMNAVRRYYILVPQESYTYKSPNKQTFLAVAFRAVTAQGQLSKLDVAGHVTWEERAKAERWIEAMGQGALF